MWRESNQKIDDIFSSKEKYAFLVGAGISINPPSNLPSGYAFMKALINHTIPKEHVNRILDLTDPYHKEVKLKGGFLRFEMFMGLIQEMIDPKLDTLEIFARCVEPNKNHHFLAEVIHNDGHVFTTNFDSLIEHALLKKGIDKNRLNVVIDKKDWESRKIKGYPVYKLHGTINDISKETEFDRRDSIQTTIKQIAKGESNENLLESWKVNKLEKILRKHDLIVCGYSGLDDFDIVPTIQSIKSSQRLIWIKHDRKKDIENAEIKELIVDLDKSSVKESKDKNNPTKRHHELFEQLLLTRKRTRENVIQVEVNTDSLVTYLINKLNLNITNYTEQITNKLEKQTINFDKIKISDSLKWELVAKIYWKLENREAFEEVYERALDLADDSGKIRLASIIGMYYKTKLKHDEGIIFLKSILQLAEKNKDLAGKADILGCIGVLLEYKGDLEGSLNYYKEALELHESKENQKGIADQLFNIGDIHRKLGDIDNAFKLYFRALDINKEYGYIHQQALVLNSIAVSYKRVGEEYFALSPGIAIIRLRNARDYYIKSIEIAELLGDLTGKALALNNLAILYRTLGQAYFAMGDSITSYEYFFQAYSCYEEEVLIYIRFGDLELLRESVGELLDFLESHNIANTKALIEILKFIETKDFEEKEEWKLELLDFIAFQFYKLEYIDEALGYYNKLIEQMNKMNREVSPGIFVEMSDLFLKKGNYEKTFSYLELVREKMESEGGGDVRNKRRLLLSYGNLYKTQGKLRQAINHFTQAREISKKNRLQYPMFDWDLLKMKVKLWWQNHLKRN